MLEINDVVLYCIVLYCIVLYCIVLYCIVETHNWLHTLSDDIANNVPRQN